MPLDTGTRLGAYEILAPLGAGGMELVEGRSIETLVPHLGRGA
jgi:hypothetical protein